jgi:hypothetical protein
VLADAGDDVVVVDPLAGAPQARGGLTRIDVRIVVDRPCVEAVDDGVAAIRIRHQDLIDRDR